MAGLGIWEPSGWETEGKRKRGCAGVSASLGRKFPRPPRERGNPQAPTEGRGERAAVMGGASGRSGGGACCA